MNNRRKLVIALGACALGTPFHSFSQQPGKVWHLGVLASSIGYQAAEDAFRRRLRELGYVEGKNLVIEWRILKGEGPNRLSELAAELVRLKVDCIIANGIVTSRAAMQATSTIPIVMANGGDDPARLGMVASLARPGGNMTGFISLSTELSGKRLELLKETLPRVSNVAVLWDPNTNGGPVTFKETAIAGNKLGIQLHPLQARDPEGMEQAFEAAGKARAQALIVVAAGVMNSYRARIAELAIKSRLPVMYTDIEFIHAGGLMSYGADRSEQWRHAADYVDKILKGAKPADLPVQQPMKFEMIVNLKAAKQIGLTIPPNVLARADKVIK
jgi:putative ABC transport system substrate-binding protein